MDGCRQRRTEWRCGRRRSREVPCLAVPEGAVDVDVDSDSDSDSVPGLGWVSEWECDVAETSDCGNVKGKGESRCCCRVRERERERLRSVWFLS